MDKKRQPYPGYVEETLKRRTYYIIYYTLYYTYIVLCVPSAFCKQYESHAARVYCNTFGLTNSDGDGGNIIKYYICCKKIKKMTFFN